MKPQPLFKESKSVFRLRALLWLCQEHPTGLTYDDLATKFIRAWPKHRISKESVVRSMKILDSRDQVYVIADTGDARRNLWFAK